MLYNSNKWDFIVLRMRRIPTTYTSTQSLSLDVSHFPKFSKVLHVGDDLGDPNNIITFHFVLVNHNLQIHSKLEKKKRMKINSRI